MRSKITLILESSIQILLLPVVGRLLWKCRGRMEWNGAEEWMYLRDKIRNRNCNLSETRNLVAFLKIMGMLGSSACVSFLGCCNKSPRTGWLKTRESYSLPVALGENPFLASPLASGWLLTTHDATWSMTTALQSEPSSSHGQHSSECVCVQISFIF